MGFGAQDRDTGGAAGPGVTRHQGLGEIEGLPAAELNPTGTLDIESADDFRATFSGLLDSGVGRFFVDLGGVSYVDSTGLGSLMQLYRQVKDRGGTMHFYNLTPPVRDIFELTHLDKIIQIHPSRQEAFSAVAGR